MHVRLDFPDPPQPITSEKIARWLRTHLTIWHHAINGQLGYGDGKDPDNVVGQWVDVVSPGADEPFVVPHTLGVVPIGFLLMIPPEQGVVNRGPSPWTNAGIQLKCTAAGQSFRIFILINSLVTAH